MKYHIVILLTIILLMLVGFEYQLDIMTNKDVFISELKHNISQQNNTISLFENYHTKPMNYLFSSPIHKDDYIKLTSPIGFRELINPFTGGSKESTHKGLDLTGTWHARVLATGSGKVIEKWYVPGGWRKGHPVFGGYIKILHENGMISGYGHLSKIYVHEGNIIKEGELIGRTGNTGLSYGEHLHFSIEDSVGFLNPLKYVEIIE